MLPQAKQKLKLTIWKYKKNWYFTMKKMLKEPEPEFDAKPVLDIKPETEEEEPM